MISLSGDKVRSILKKSLPSLSSAVTFTEPQVFKIGTAVFESLNGEIDAFTNRFDKEVIAQAKPGTGARGQDPCSDEHVGLIITALKNNLNSVFVKHAVFCRGDVDTDPPSFKEFMRAFFFGITAWCSTCACEAG